MKQRGRIPTTSWACLCVALLAGCTSSTTEPPADALLEVALQGRVTNVFFSAEDPPIWERVGIGDPVTLTLSYSPHENVQDCTLSADLSIAHVAWSTPLFWIDSINDRGRDSIYLRTDGSADYTLLVLVQDSEAPFTLVEDEMTSCTLATVEFRATTEARGRVELPLGPQRFVIDFEVDAVGRVWH